MIDYDIACACIYLIATVYHDDMTLFCFDTEIGHVLPATAQASIRESLQSCVMDHQHQRLVQSISSKLILS